MATKAKAIDSYRDYLDAKDRALALAKQIVEDLHSGTTGGDIENARGAVSELRSLIARLREWNK